MTFASACLQFGSVENLMNMASGSFWVVSKFMVYVCLCCWIVFDDFLKRATLALVKGGGCCYSMRFIMW